MLSRSGNEIEEVNEILDKVAQNIFVNATNSLDDKYKCCRTGIRRPQGMLVVHSYDEFMYAISLCKLALVLITSTYCPYCHMFRPIFAKVARIHSNKAIFIEINADHMPEVALSLNVFSTPTTVIFIDKRPVDAIVGYMPFSSFNDYVNEVLNRIGCLSP